MFWLLDFKSAIRTEGESTAYMHATFKQVKHVSHLSVEDRSYIMLYGAVYMTPAYGRHFLEVCARDHFMRGLTDAVRSPNGAHEVTCPTLSETQIAYIL